MALSGHADILEHAMKYKRVTINAIMMAIVAHAAGLVGVAAAQGFPTRPVTFVAAGPVGGPTDAIGRIVAEGMRSVLGQAILIENVASSRRFAKSAMLSPTATRSNSVIGVRMWWMA
jgi:hypothetical protein